MALFHFSVKSDRSDIRKMLSHQKFIIEQLLKIKQDMPTKAEFSALAQELRDAFLNISNDITRLTDQLAAGGMTDAEEAEVLEEFRTLAADAKALADRTPEAPTEPTEPTEPETPEQPEA